MLRAGLFRRTLLVVAVPVIVGGGAYYAYRRRLANNKAVTAADYHHEQAAAISEALKNSETLKSQPLVLYQYYTCPFCNKVKAFLNTQDLKYETVEVDPIFKTEIKNSGYGKVPQLQIGKEGPRLVDSEAILNYLAPVLLPKEAVYSNNVPHIRSWANEVLARYLVINTNRSWNESFQGYDYVQNVEDFTAVKKMAVKIVGGITMHIVSEYVTKKRLEPFGYKKGQDERTALYTEVQQHWLSHLPKEGAILHGGPAPDLADIEVYGILQSVRNFPVYDDVLQNCNAIVPWIERMDQEVSKHSSKQAQRKSE
jgi:microsomal prostaglandin-E synthase 2